MTDFQPIKRPRRFIAGVVCPKCSAMDKTVMYSNEQEEVRECVSCGFTQTMREHEAESNELVTRVTPLGKPILDEDEKPLKIIGLE